MLPSGLASISARMDDAPNVRGAVAFGGMVREREENSAFADIAAGLHDAIRMVEAGDITRADFDRHASLICGSAYKGRDQR